jgi:hypothetical protein
MMPLMSFLGIELSYMARLQTMAISATPAPPSREARDGQADKSNPGSRHAFACDRVRTRRRPVCLHRPGRLDLRGSALGPLQ